MLLLQLLLLLLLLSLLRRRRHHRRRRREDGVGHRRQHRRLRGRRRAQGQGLEPGYESEIGGIMTRFMLVLVIGTIRNFQGNICLSHLNVYDWYLYH